MTYQQLASLLESMTGHLKASSTAQEKLLQQAREKIAVALLQEKVPDTGSEQLFADSDFYAREKIGATQLKAIDALAKKVIERNDQDPIRVFVRSTPVRDPQVAGSMPDWAVGIQPTETLGPFLNNEGREIWIDVFKIVKLVTLYIGNTPVLLFNATFRGRLIPFNQPIAATSYDVAPGSVWVQARLFSATAPADKYVGVKVKDGTIKLSKQPTLTNGKLTIDASTHIDVSLELVATEAAAAAPGDYGKDARDAVYQMPETWSFSCQQQKATVTAVGPASCKIYGQAASFSYTTAAAVFNPVISAVGIPWKASANQFEVTACVSPFMTVEGAATLSHSWWTLPAATLDVANPLEATGNGGVLLQCETGLSARWQGLQNQSIQLVQPFIGGNPGNLSIIDLLSDGAGALHHLDLWKDAQNPYGTEAILLMQEDTPFIYVVNGATGQELLTTQCDAEITADRPVKVNGEPFAIRSELSALMLGANATRRLIYLYDDNLLTEKAPIGAAAVIKPAAIALENAVLTVSPVAGFLLFGECDETWETVVRANCFLTFGLYSYLPSLPDPYIANLTRWRRLFGNRKPGSFAERSASVAAASLSMLICAIRYAPVDEETDEVETGFYFGSFAGNITELPDSPSPEPAPQPVSPRLRRLTLNRVPVINLPVSRLATTSIARVGVFKTAQKINLASLTVKANPFTEAILRPGDITAVPVPNTPKPELDTTVKGDQLDSDIRKVQKSNDFEGFWDDSVGAARLNNEVFALLDVSSNANQLGISVSGDKLVVQTGRVTAGADGSAAVVNTGGNFPFVIEGMSVKSPAHLVRSFTLPQIAWEPLINLTAPDREDPLNTSSPKLAMDPEAGYLYFPNDGGATRIWNNGTSLVSLAPIPMVQTLLDDFVNNPQSFTVSAFTLPFGLKAISYISRHFVEPQKPDIANIRPRFRKQEDGNYKLEGGIQLRLTAGNYGKVFPDAADNDAPMFPGYTVQLNNLLNMVGMPSGASNLGHRVTEIFNNEFLIAALSLSNQLDMSRGVPVSRMDITGYGANIFSKWISPSAAMAQTSQARFDVMMGRTGHEVIQVKSILYPWGIRVVRTITVFRSSTGYVYRTDSGWKAESDGLFDFSYRYKKKNADPYSTNPADFITESEPYEFHPGVIKGLFNVRNIKDAPSVAEYTAENTIAIGADYLNGVKGQVYKNEQGKVLHEPVKCGPVYFDADVEIENVVQGHTNKRVVSKKILGYVQVAPAGKPLTPVQLRDLLQLQNGSIGGDLDCVVDINNSDQQMQLNQFDVNVSVDAGGSNPVFVIAARGNVFLPKDGSWAMVKHTAGTGEVVPMSEQETVPLIRTGKWKKGPVIDPAAVNNQLLRLAHPLEILRAPGDSTINFGYLQSTATQKALFLTPAYGKGIKKLMSKTPPVFADAYRLMTGNSIFPNIGNAIDNFGKAMPLLKGIDNAGNAATAFVTNALKDGADNVLELLEVQAVKAGEAAIQQGMNMLQKGANGVLDKALKFDVPPFEIPLVDLDALRIYIEYKTGKNDAPANSYVDSKLNFDVQSFANDLGDQWKSRLNNLAMVVDLGDMKRLMTIKGNFDASKAKESGYEGGPDNGLSGLPVPEIEFSEALQPVIDILQVLAQLSQGNYGEAMKKGLKIAMGNSGEIWEYKFEATKEIPLVRFPPTDELYNSAQTPLKLECSLGLGVYFNAALKITTDPGQLLPTAGAFLKFHGGLQVMCVSVGVGSIYAIGSVDVKIACDTKVGPSLALDFGFGVSLVVSLPVVGSVSVTYMVGVQMYADKDKVVIAAMMLFRGNATLLGGLVCVTITIEAKGIIERSGGQTDCSAQVTFALDISIFLIIDISFSKTWGESRQIA